MESPHVLLLMGRKGEGHDLSRWKLKPVKTECPERKIICHWEPMLTGLSMIYVRVKFHLTGRIRAHLATSSGLMTSCRMLVMRWQDAVMSAMQIYLCFWQLIGQGDGDTKTQLDIDMIAPDHGIMWKSLRRLSRCIRIWQMEGIARLLFGHDVAQHRIYDIASYAWYRDEGVDCKVVKLRSAPMSVRSKSSEITGC